MTGSRFVELAGLANVEIATLERNRDPQVRAAARARLLEVLAELRALEGGVGDSVTVLATVGPRDGLH